MTISTKGLFYPISVIRGNTLSFSVEFNIDGEQQYFSDYDFAGFVYQTDGENNFAQFIFTENLEDANLIDIKIPSTETRFAAGDYVYEIKGVSTVDGDLEARTILRGSFTLIETFGSI